jgi:hypothetical protein
LHAFSVTAVPFGADVPIVNVILIMQGVGLNRYAATSWTQLDYHFSSLANLELTSAPAVFNCASIPPAAKACFKAAKTGLSCRRSPTSMADLLFVISITLM